MKSITHIIWVLFAAGCSSNPIIIPDNTKDNVVVLEIKNRINDPQASSTSYGWLFWYAPLAILLILWGWRNLVKKPIDCVEKEPNSLKIQDKIDGNPET
jgi:hypothetical protein